MTGGEGENFPLSHCTPKRLAVSSRIPMDFLFSSDDSGDTYFPPSSYIISFLHPACPGETLATCCGRLVWAERELPRFFHPPPMSNGGCCCVSAYRGSETSQEWFFKHQLSLVKRRGNCLKKEEGKELGTLAVQMLITNFLLPSAICFRNRHHAWPHKKKKKKKLERERETPFFYTPLPNSWPADTYLPKRGRGEKDHNLACVKEERKEGGGRVYGSFFLKKMPSQYIPDTVAKQKWSGIEKKKRKGTKTDTFFSP